MVLQGFWRNKKLLLLIRVLTEWLKWYIHASPSLPCFKVDIHSHIESVGYSKLPHWVYELPLGAHFKTFLKSKFVTFCQVCTDWFWFLIDVIEPKVFLTKPSNIQICKVELIAIGKGLTLWAERNIQRILIFADSFKCHTTSWKCRLNGDWHNYGYDEKWIWSTGKELLAILWAPIHRRLMTKKLPTS